ncbi:MAG: DUF4492 domain-containing protein [Paraprevotella sp.]|nr:DUF4492 domain-containing protein [Paraprevotella sp.]
MMQTLIRIGRFYRDGFRNMTWGRVLWVIILVKRFIMFFVLRLFFFPNFLDGKQVGEDKGAYVGRELIRQGM